MPRHGDTRNEEVHTVPGADVEYRTAGGAIAYAGPGSTYTYTEIERYCAHRDMWITTLGITGMIRFLADHDSGYCSQ